MLERGADVTCTDTNKNTALHLAAKQGSFTIISMLLKKGININAQNAVSIFNLTLLFYTYKMFLKWYDSMRFLLFVNYSNILMKCHSHIFDYFYIINGF